MWVCEEKDEKEETGLKCLERGNGLERENGLERRYGLGRGYGLEKDEGRKELLGLPEGGSVSDRMKLSGWSGVLYGWVGQAGRVYCMDGVGQSGRSNLFLKSNLSLKVD